MSWPAEEWKAGLPAQALRAIAELEQRLERAVKERQQKQVQLDTLEALAHKQRQKHDDEKAAWTLLAQENRSLAEACEQLERTRQRLAQELQAKEAHLGCLESQLAQATRRQTELEEELHRCQGELEKLQSCQALSPSPWGSSTPWAEGAEPRTENNRTPPARITELEPSCPLLGEPCVEDAPCQEASFPGAPQKGPDPTGNGDRARSADSEVASTGEKLKTENQELRLALTRAERQIQDKEQEVWTLQGQLEVTQLELAQWKQQHGRRSDLAEPAGIRDCRGRRLSEDVVRLRQSQEQEKGLAGTERAPSGSSRRSASSSRLEQLAERRGSATRPKGLAPPSPRAPSAQRGQEELQALRAEVSALRRRLEASESQRKYLLESCWQQQRTRAWVQERPAPPLGLRAASWQRKADALPGSRPRALEGTEGSAADKEEFGDGGKKVPEAPTGDKTTELRSLEEAETRTPDLSAGLAKPEMPPGTTTGDPSEAQALANDGARPERSHGPEEDLEALRETVRTLTAGKAEAEAHAGLAQQKLQSLQATLGRQTDRLARALEAQSRHVEGLVAGAEEKEQAAEGLRAELAEAKAALEVAEPESRRLRALLEEKEEALHSAGSRESPGFQGAEPRSRRDLVAQNGLAAHAQEAKHAQAELETFLAQLLRENQALRRELIHWEAMIVDQEDLNPSSLSSKLHREATAGNVLQASQKVALLLQESHRDAQTQTEGSELGVPHLRRERVSVAFDNTQYEPYGLPEVVMKGFADIPSGPSCPYVLRRGILGSAPVAQLAPKAVPEEDGLEAEEGSGI